MEKNKNLKELKKDYEKLRKKHSLPSFDELNKNFSIERISETETDFLLREVRRAISEKINIYIRIIETFLQPTNCPIYIFSIAKLLNTNNKEKLAEIYKKLAELEFKILEIDLEFAEEKEANFIKEAYNVWMQIKESLLKILDFITKNFEKKSKTEDRNYFI